MMDKLGFQTKAIHTKGSKNDPYRGVKMPIHIGVAFDFASAQDMEDSFLGKKPAHTYSRITNPTVEAFERKMVVLEQALTAVAVASGMAAISNTILNLTLAGENIVASNTLFGNTYSLFRDVLKPLDIETKFVNIDNLEEVKHAINEKTRLLFFETIANHPLMNVPDIQALVELAHVKNVVVIVDNTVTTPFLFQAKKYGVDLAVHSSTKFISGGGTDIGGVIVDFGNFDWSKIPALHRFHQMRQFAFIARLRKEVFRDIGACMSPQTAYLHSLGLETLALRVQRSSENAQKVAIFLQNHEKVKKVFYPGLTSDPYHSLAKQQFEGYFGGILGFELNSKELCFQCLDQLKIIKRASNLNDNTSLIIHPESTIFVSFSKEDREKMKVTNRFIRFSVGIENVEDLIEDLEQALEIL